MEERELRFEVESSAKGRDTYPSIFLYRLDGRFRVMP